MDAWEAFLLSQAARRLEAKYWRRASPMGRLRPAAYAAIARSLLYSLHRGDEKWCFPPQLAHFWVCSVKAEVSYRRPGTGRHLW